MLFFPYLFDEKKVSDFSIDSLRQFFFD